MKNLTLALVCILISIHANAALYDRGRGLIYDDILDITWLQDANAGGRLTWQAANTWADNLGYGGYNDWRLPSCSITGVGCGESGELSHMYLVNLGNSPFQSPTTLNHNFVDEGSGNILSFFNVPHLLYWYSEEMPVEYRDPSPFAHAYNWTGGSQAPGTTTHDDKSHAHGAWAVRDGDVSDIPLPAAAWLFLSALGGLVVIRRKRS